MMWLCWYVYMIVVISTITVTFYLEHSTLFFGTTSVTSDVISPVENETLVAFLSLRYCNNYG